MANKLRPTGVYQRFVLTAAICLALLGSSWAQTFEEPTQTTRDDHGVWFIQEMADATLYDMFEAMGYAVATDRLWQAELYRRQARGRLAEILGAGEDDTFLKTDIFMRTIAYTKTELDAGFASLNEDTQDMILGYVDGFNRRIDEIVTDPTLSELPYEFFALYRRLGPAALPTHWTPNDILAWHATLQRNFDPEALDSGQLDNIRLLTYLNQRVGDPVKAWGMFEDLRWTNDLDAATYFDPDRRPCRPATAAAAAAIGPEAYVQTAERLAQERRQMLAGLEKIGARVRMGSYAWVVSGEHTVSGNPILYSGPQMGFSVPSIVTEGSLRGAGLEISGMTIPGIPSIIIGRTPHHTWSMQVGHAHTTDYYFHRSPSELRFDRMETIAVAGGDAVEIPVWYSGYGYGPVISPLALNPKTYTPSQENPIVTWRYAHRGHEFKAMEGFLDLGRAEDMDAFGEGIEKVAVSQHFCYADREGNIAYWMSGRDPQRIVNGHDWRLPQGSLQPLDAEMRDDGWDDELVRRSTDRNTPRGYYGGWNNKSQPDYDNAYNSINDIYGPFQRSHVIYDYLDRRLKMRRGQKLSFEEIRDLALDIAATDSLGRGGNPWRFVGPYFQRAVWRATWQRGDWHRKIQRLRALRLLWRWDGHFVAGGPAAWAEGPDRADAWMLMDAWVHEVLRLTFGDELGPYLSAAGEDPNSVMAARQWPNGERRVLINVLLHALDRRSDIVNEYDWFEDMGGGIAGRDRIIVAALDNALDHLGRRPWGEGQRDWITYTHSLLGQEVWRTPFSSRSTYAHVVEMGPEGPVRIESMFPLGQSGNIAVDAAGEPDFDDHFFSMTAYFDTFTPRPFPLFD